MSNVLDRFKSLSDMAFYSNLCDIQKMFNMLLLGKYTPKKYRYIHSTPVIQKIEDMLDSIARLNNINATADPGLLEYKRSEQKKLINECNVLYRRLQTLMNTVWYQRLHTEGQAKECLERHIFKLARMIERESALLVGWRDKTKLKVK